MHAQVGAVLDRVANHVISKPRTVRDAVDLRPIVFVIGDDRSIRESVERAISTMGCDSEDFASAEEFLMHPRGAGPCCVIVDLALPGLSGLELQQQLAGHRDMPMIFVTEPTDIAMTVRAMKAGAVEVLTKPLRPDLLVRTIHDAFELSRTALRLQGEMRALTECYESLSRREREVMALVVAGLLNKVVAFELGISETTVKAHRGQVMRKMRAGSLPHLVTIAARLGVQRGARH